ncbi:UgpE ABC-type sugar transport system, permease component [Candidatus Nanopelagicaceae bacterium]
MKIATKKAGYLRPRSNIANVAMLLAIGYFIIPIIWVFVNSTKNNEQLFNTFSLWFPDDWNLLTNLSALATEEGGVYLTWFRNTILYAVSSAVGATIVCAMGGYALARFAFKGKIFLEASILSMVMVPATVLVMPLYLMLSKLNLVNTIWAVILPSLLSPFGVFLVKVFIESSIPDEILQAARIDRAGEFRIFWQIVLPMLRPALVTVFLFSLVSSWNNFFLPLVMLSEQKYYPLTVGLAAWFNQASQEGGNSILFNLVIAGSLVAVIPLIISFIFLQRYWQGGISAGSVK